MKTIENYIEAAIKKGYKFEAYTNICSNYCNLNDDLNMGTDETHFGFTKDNKVWFWFAQANYPEFKDLKPYVRFNHRYNTINGSTIKSSKQGCKAEKLLEVR
mgnify:FL=1